MNKQKLAALLRPTKETSWVVDALFLAIPSVVAIAILIAALHQGSNPNYPNGGSAFWPIGWREWLPLILFDIIFVGVFVGMFVVALLRLLYRSRNRHG